MRRAALAAVVVVGVLAALSPAGRVGVAQTREQPEPETYHWVLPVNQPSVDVATLHPNDCYVIQQATGVAYFGEPSANVLELERHLANPIAHPIDTVEDHPECELRVCVEVSQIATAIEQELRATGNQSLLRTVDHTPSPLDNWAGGAYADVGSDDRQAYRNTPEQLMLVERLAASRRGNCFEAKVPRTLSVHVRDQQRDRKRAGVYSGFLYIEHHHPLIAGDTIVRNSHGGADDR